jgi:hypothetical protein
MEDTVLYDGKPFRAPTREEIKSEEKRSRREKREWKKRREAEEAEEKELQLKEDKQTGRDKFTSSQALQRSSTDILKQVMAEAKVPVKAKELFDAVLKAKLGKRFSRETRADKHRILAVGCAVYHQLAAQRDPREALRRLADSAEVEVGRITDPCRIIVECLVDYGANGRSEDRQYVARDARALSYVIREGMSPQEVMNPAKGETITIWANREAEYRAQARLKTKGQKEGSERAVTTEPLPGQLPSLSLTQAAYKAIQDMVGKGVVVVSPRGGDEALALAVAPLENLTADKAARKPRKVTAALKKALRTATANYGASNPKNTSDW